MLYIEREIYMYIYISYIHKHIDMEKWIHGLSINKVGKAGSTSGST